MLTDIAICFFPNPDKEVAGTPEKVLEKGPEAVWPVQ